MMPVLGNDVAAAAAAAAAAHCCLLLPSLSLSDRLVSRSFRLTRDCFYSVLNSHSHFRMCIYEIDYTPLGFSTVLFVFASVAKANSFARTHIV